eukprot:EC838238.1.p4 GENE.EC838238.1~~EC838238.1.p4  ORF type:complete len:77 (+),score=6.87 EC838238.1:365-595(+)
MRLSLHVCQEKKLPGEKHPSGEREKPPNDRAIVRDIRGKENVKGARRMFAKEGLDRVLAEKIEVACTEIRQVHPLG